MQARYDYTQYAILYVDDEEKSLKYFRDIFGTKFRVLTAESAQKGYEILQANAGKVGMVMSDQRMPGEKGVPFLSRVREFDQKIIRILVTAYSDLETAVDAVNTGAVYKYITKPWDLPLLDATLLRGMEFFLVQHERDQLLEEKLSAMHRLMITDRVVSLGVLAAGLSHQLRNSLDAVQSFVDLAPPALDGPMPDLAKLQYPEVWHRYYDRVRGQMGKIEQLLNGLVETARPPLPQFNDQVSLYQALHKALDRFQTKLSERGIKVENTVPKNLPTLKCDAALMDRMIDSILEEILLVVPVGGRVTFDGVKESEQLVRLQVTTQGGGLQLESLRWIFDPFEELKPEGNRPGLNLLASFLVAYHHGGVVRCVPDEKDGCVVRYLLPLNPDQMLLQEGQRNFLTQMLFSESLWEKLLGHQM